MSKNKSPRKKYKPKPKYYNTLDVAINRAALIDKSAKVQIQIINHSALRNLNNGTATLSDLKRLTAAINMSDAMQHIRLGRDYIQIINAARGIILNIAQTQSEPYASLQSQQSLLIDWINLHDAQLDIASNGDILSCQEIINNHMRSGNVDRINITAT